MSPKVGAKKMENLHLLWSFGHQSLGSFRTVTHVTRISGEEISCRAETNMGQDWGMIIMITFAPKLRLRFTVFRRCSTWNLDSTPLHCTNSDSTQQGSTHFSRKKCPKTTKTSPFKQARSRLAESESFQISPVGPWRSEQRAQFISCASSVLCTDPLTVSGMMGDTLGYIGIDATVLA